MIENIATKYFMRNLPLRKHKFFAFCICISHLPPDMHQPLPSGSAGSLGHKEHNSALSRSLHSTLQNSTRFLYSTNCNYTSILRITFFISSLLDRIYIQIFTEYGPLITATFCKKIGFPKVTESFIIVFATSWAIQRVCFSCA